MSLKITVNGIDRDVAAGITLENFLSEQGINPQTIVAEHNLNIIQKTDYATLVLKDGDVLEILNFVGGG